MLGLLENNVALVTGGSPHHFTPRAGAAAGVSKKQNLIGTLSR
jgi:hypothetical protein